MHRGAAVVAPEHRGALDPLGEGEKGPARTAAAGAEPGAVADPNGCHRPAGAGARQQSVRQRLQPVDRLAAHLDQLADADRLHLPVADVGVDRAAGRQAERPLLDLGQAGGLERGLDGVLDAVQDRGRGEADPATREHADPDASAGTAVDAGQPVVLVVHGVARRLGVERLRLVRAQAARVLQRGLDQVGPDRRFSRHRSAPPGSAGGERRSRPAAAPARPCRSRRRPRRAW